MQRNFGYAVAFAPLVLILSLSVLTGCGAQPGDSELIDRFVQSGEAPEANTDPRKDEVNLGQVNSEHVTKKCDGTTLIYVSSNRTLGSGGIAVIQNSPECAE